MRRGPVNKKLIVLVIATVILFFAPLGHSQQAGRVWHVGLIHVGLDHTPQSLEPLRAGLKALGYAQGKNIYLDWRNLPDEEAARESAKEFVRNRVDLIVAWENQTVRAAKAATAEIPVVFISVTAEGAGASRAAKNASATIPIVMAHVNDPIMLGLVASLADPGGNITGHIQSITRVERQAFGVDQSSASGVTCGMFRLSVLDNLPRVAPPASSMFRSPSYERRSARLKNAPLQRPDPDTSRHLKLI